MKTQHHKLLSTVASKLKLRRYTALLQRQQQTAITPKLTISPLFRFDDEPIDQPGRAVQVDPVKPKLKLP
jgi:hypothetical protein